MIVGLVSLLPFIELRGSLPIAVLGYHWPILPALLFCMFFSAIPGLVIALHMDRLEPFLRRVGFIDRGMTRVFAKTRTRHEDPVQRERRDRRASILLALLVAVPGPGTGAWTGGIVSYVFGVEKRKAFAAIALGVLGEGVVIGILVVLFNSWLF